MSELKHRLGTVFGDKKRAKTDLSSTALNAHARLIIIRDCKAAFDVLRRHCNITGNVPVDEIDAVNQAIGEVEHHWFMHREELEPVRYPAEQARREAGALLDEELADEIEDEDPELAAIRAHIEAQGDEE